MSKIINSSKICTDEVITITIDAPEDYALFIEWMDDRTNIVHVFAGHRHAEAILFQTLRLGLGHLRVDSVSEPNVAWFSYYPMNFVAGNPHSDEAQLLVETIPYLNIIIVPDDDWARLVKEQYGEELRVQQRTKFNPDSLDIAMIRRLKNNIPSGFELQKINRDNLRRVNPAVCRIIDLHFRGVDGLLQHGVGFCAVQENQIFSLAYSAFPFIDEFQVQVDTVESPHYRRRGLATAVSAALIEYALENDIVPHWDAANLASIKLAEKLGYSDPVPWEAYYRVKS